mmetsp:Transcript_86685/g.231421  ORF Transcript_86685/g.231421 Transcript_86685/m.231421 type:complete len:145 (-) Transcript_86685:9-443(-)
MQISTNTQSRVQRDTLSTPNKTRRKFLPNEYRYKLIVSLVHSNGSLSRSLMDEPTNLDPAIVDNLLKEYQGCDDTELCVNVLLGVIDQKRKNDHQWYLSAVDKMLTSYDQAIDRHVAHEIHKAIGKELSGWFCVTKRPTQYCVF